MFRVKQQHRIWIFLFALWLMFEPLAITVARAGDAPIPRGQPQTFNPTNPEVADAVEPQDALEKVLKLSGIVHGDMTGNNVKGDVEGRAYADFLMVVTSAYDLMDAGSADAISFVSVGNKFVDVTTNLTDITDAKDQFDTTGKVIKVIKGSGENAADLIKLMERGSKKLFMFFGATQRSMKQGWKRNVIRGFTKSARFMKNFMPKFGEFLETMEAPKGLTESKKYFSFFKKGTESGMSKVEFAGRSVGIGLNVLTIALETTKIAMNDDTHGTKQMSYENVKSGLNILVAACALIAMVWAVPFGTIAAIGAVVMLIGSYICDKIGEFNAKWKQAYRRSFDFLQKEDPEFRIFYEKREKVVKERRSAAWIKADDEVQQWRKGVTDAKALERINGIYTTLEKQGVLATYYNRAKFKLPRLDLNTLQDLYKRKADYMAWKPTDEEKKKEEERSSFSKAMDYVKIWNYPVWGVNKIREKMADNKMKDLEESYPPVYFNPDFLLCRRYQNFLMAKKERQGALYDVVGLRIEQAPFNYIWMITMDSSLWNQDMMISAIEGDIFFCGVKEMQYLSKALEEAVSQLKDAVKKSDEKLSDTEKFLDNMKRQRVALSKLIAAYNAEKDDETKDWMPKSGIFPDEYREVWKPCHGAFEWGDSAFVGNETPRMNAKKVIQRYRAELEQRLALIPHSINKRKIEMVQLDLMIKNILDRAVLFRKLGEDRQDSLKSFSDDFKGYPALKSYLEENKFLDVNGGFLDKTMNWMSGISPAMKDMEHYTNLYMDAVEDFEALAKKANSTERGWIFKSHLPDPEEMTQKLNEELKEFREVMKEYEDVSTEIDLNACVKSDQDGYFKETKVPFGKDVKPLNIEEIVQDVEGDAINSSNY